MQKVEEQVAKEARERQSAMLKQNTVGSNLTQRKDDETGRTAEIMAKKMGISNGRGQFAPSERVKAPVITFSGCSQAFGQVA